MKRPTKEPGLRGIPGHCRGVTLIEVLIAMLVTSIGLLGLAGLQVYSLKSNQSAALQAQANVLAYDILDRMRGNPTLAQTGGYNISLKSAAPSDAGSINGIDLSQWRGMLASSLPSGTGSVSCTAARECTVVVQWVDPSITFDRDGDGDTDTADTELSITLVSAL